MAEFELLCGCPESVPVLTLDATDAKAVAAAVRRAKVVLNVLHRECDRSVPCQRVLLLALRHLLDVFSFFLSFWEQKISKC